MRYWLLSICILTCLGAGFFSGMYTDTSSAWFLELEKPFFYPPGFVFGIVWSVLYVLMGLSIFIIFEKTKEQLPKVLFGIQLILNLLWPIIFFQVKSLWLALIEITILFFVLLSTMIEFKQHSKTAFRLLIPYILWVGFATLLTASILFLN
jgi:benzodiazapine receptor